MQERTCTLAGCETKHYAKGLCRPHYRIEWRKVHGRRRAEEYYDRECVTCGAAFRSARATGKFCSDDCKGQHYSATMRTRSKLPAGHPVIVEIARQRKAARTPREPKRSAFEWRTARECPACACMFTPLYTPNAICCSVRCSRKMSRRRRRAREHNTVNNWRWSDFMRIARRFEFCCAYCGERNGQQLEPDHVIPLSRGGYDSTANLLPACRACNCDKRDLLLDEWNADRERRGLAPRLTAWTTEDRRFNHLTQALLEAA